MPQRIPHLELTQGQVAWTLSLGNRPSKVTVDQLRYLRHVGVPFAEQELGNGRGHHLVYGFNHLIECGLGLYAIRRGMKPGEAANYLISERSFLRKKFAQIFRDQPEGALQAGWVKSRGHILPTFGSDHQLRMHRRYSETPGKIEMVNLDDISSQGTAFGDLIERYPDGEALLLVPLTRLVIEWTAWALDVPVIKRGRAAA